MIAISPTIAISTAKTECPVDIEKVAPDITPKK